MLALSHKTQKIASYSVLFICLTYTLAVSISGISKPYSLWIDELYTAYFTIGSWSDFWLNRILPDTHPPLYFAITKLWAAKFGISEISLRYLSLIFSTLTVIALWINWHWSKRSSDLIALLFIISNPYFIYYAQEARSYSCLLFASTCLFIFSIKQRSNRLIKNKSMARGIFYGLCVGTSLIHYFGFIFSFIILSIEFLENKITHSRKITATFFIPLLSWPVIHLIIYGSLVHSQISNIALENQPWWMPLHSYSISNLPFINSGNSIVDYFFAFILILSFGTYLRHAFGQSSKKLAFVQKNEYYYCSVFILTSLISITAANLISPISTFRNYIVFITPTSLLLSIVCEFLLRLNSKDSNQWIAKLAVISTLSMSIALSCKISSINLEQKIYNTINYKGLSEHLITDNTCANGCYSNDFNPEDSNSAKIMHYYFKDVNLRNISELDDKAKSPKVLPIVGSGLEESEINQIANRYGYTIKHLICHQDKCINRKAFVLMPN